MTAATWRAADDSGGCTRASRRAGQGRQGGCGRCWLAAARGARERAMAAATPVGRERICECDVQMLARERPRVR